MSAVMPPAVSFFFCINTDLPVLEQPSSWVSLYPSFSFYFNDVCNILFASGNFKVMVSYQKIGPINLLLSITDFNGELFAISQ